MVTNLCLIYPGTRQKAGTLAWNRTKTRSFEGFSPEVHRDKGMRPARGEDSEEVPVDGFRIVGDEVIPSTGFEKGSVSGPAIVGLLTAIPLRGVDDAPSTSGAVALGGAGLLSTMIRVQGYLLGKLRRHPFLDELAHGLPCLSSRLAPSHGVEPCVQPSEGRRGIRPRGHDWSPRQDSNLVIFLRTEEP